jgi:hypothetical protein
MLGMNQSDEVKILGMSIIIMSQPFEKYIIKQSMVSKDPKTLFNIVTLAKGEPRDNRQFFYALMPGVKCFNYL